MSLPVQPAPHSASGRSISLGKDDVASPRAYPGDLVYDFAGIEIQNKDAAILRLGLASDRHISRSPIRRNKHGMRVSTRRGLLDNLPRREIDLGDDPLPAN
jgi:hypothetical protein